MNPVLVTLIFAASMLNPMSGFSERFTADEYQVSIDLSSEWEHDSTDSFGYVLYDPKTPSKKRKIRIHFPPAGATSPKEQVPISLAFVNEHRNGKAPQVIRYEKPVTTRSGMQGYMAAHGYKEDGNCPYVNHYYFKIPCGKIICVCAYVVGGDKDTELRMENFILNSLELLPANENKKS
jgi:hypothetical protein